MEKTRLNKFISHNTNYSRREADELIKAGKVSIAGRVVSDLATSVDEDDKVRINGRLIKLKKEFTVIVYHKQKGELVSKKDDRGRKTIYDTLDKKFAKFVSVGRLDYASEGLLLLTDAPAIATAPRARILPKGKRRSDKRGDRGDDKWLFRQGCHQRRARKNHYKINGI